MSNEELFCQDCHRAANTRCVAEKHSMAKAEPDVEEIAKGLLVLTIGKVAPAVYRGMVKDVAEALKARDERAARIVEDAWRRLDALNAEAAEPMRAVLDAIRQGKG